MSVDVEPCKVMQEKGFILDDSLSFQTHSGSSHVDGYGENGRRNLGARF